MARGLTPGQVLDALESSVTLLRPGDVVAVTFDRALGDDEFDQVQADLAKVRDETGVRFALFGNGAKVTVVRPEAAT